MYKQMLIRGVLVSAVRSRQSYLALQRGATGTGLYPSHQHHDRSSASRADGICRWPELSFMLAACRGDTEPKDMPNPDHSPRFALSENTAAINLSGVLPTRIKATAGNTQDMEFMQKQTHWSSIPTQFFWLGTLKLNNYLKEEKWMLVTLFGLTREVSCRSLNGVFCKTKSCVLDTYSSAFQFHPLLSG